MFDQLNENSGSVSAFRESLKDEFVPGPRSLDGQSGGLCVEVHKRVSNWRKYDGKATQQQLLIHITMLDSRQRWPLFRMVKPGVNGMEP